MAEVFAKVQSGKGRGRKIQQAMGLTSEAQQRLRLEAVLGAHRADALLRVHRNSGDSSITTESGRVDHYVILDDTRGLNAALSIEYGRKAIKPSEDPADPESSVAQDVGMKGLFILHEAMKFSPGSASGAGLKDGGGEFDE